MSDEKYSDCVNAFTFDLFRILCEKSEKNEFFSSFSILSALNMALLGAKNNTETEFFHGLRYNLGFQNIQEVHKFFQKIIENKSHEENELTLNVANRMLIHKSPGFIVDAEYINGLLTIYKAQVDEINFETENESAVKTCNEWVNQATKGKIPSIVDKLEKDTKSVILNAIYFKGVWETPFEKEFTENQPFFNFGEKDKAKDVPLMFMSDVNATLYKKKIDGEDLLLLKLPYKGAMTMNILMTKSLNGLKMIETKLNYDVIRTMDYVCNRVNKLWLPKFKMDTSYDLSEQLKQMGIKEAFSDSADFTGIRIEKDIKISKVIHKASIDINEEGTIAAAATAILMVECCSLTIKPKIEFRVDHPFVYFIQDSNNGLILFSGIVNAF